MFKRFIDIVGSVAGLAVLSPVFLGVAIAIKLDSRGPMFFRQTRVGRGGSIFRIHKFRTMYIDAESRGLQITVGRDPRITAVGGFLRHYKLDELPQLIDVLAGKMSFVGPRPEVPAYVACYPDDIRSIVLSVRPGITDNASIQFRSEGSLLEQAADPDAYYRTEILPRKLAAYVRYVESHSTLGDLGILWRTLLAVIRVERAPD